MGMSERMKVLLRRVFDARGRHPDGGHLAGSKLIKQVGYRIRERRTAKGMTIAQFAEATQLSAAGLSKAERGLTALRLSTLERLAESLEVPPAALLEESAAGLDEFDPARAATFDALVAELRTQLEEAKEARRQAEIRLAKMRTKLESTQWSAIQIGQTVAWLKKAHPELRDEIGVKLKEMEERHPDPNRRKKPK